MEQSKAEVIEKLMELSFCYSQILQRHTFRREGIQTFRDTVSEQLFYECLYKIVNLIVQNQFDNPKLQSIIEAEIARLFRTQSFSLTKNDRKEIRLFIPSEKLYHLRQEMGFKPPYVYIIFYSVYPTPIHQQLIFFVGLRNLLEGR